MHSSFQHGSLLRGLMAVMVLVGASACSRPDRAPSGDDAPETGAATTTTDTQSNDTLSASKSTGTPNAPAAVTAQDTAEQHGQHVSGYQPMQQDTSSDAASPHTATRDTAVVGDSAHVGKTGERLQPSRTSEEANADTLADQAQSERVRPPEDSSETQGTVTADSAAADTMARDTTTDIGQVDTTASQHLDTVAMAETDTSAVPEVEASMQQQDTLAQASADTTAIQVQVDTTSDQAQTEVAVETQSDTAVVVGDSAQVAKTGERLEPAAADAEANADTLATETERVRPPEDSTEVLGNVNTADSVAVKAEADAEVHADSDTEVHADSTPTTDPNVAAVGDANVESVGAARIESTGGIATGEAAVSAMTRVGQRCIVLDPEQSPDVRWDLASSPAALNPCGTGTMTLPRIWTGERR
jgi:hypothetical protein